MCDRDVTPWGESWGTLVGEILGDRFAPPVLILAAFRAKHGDDRELRSLVADAVALHEAESGKAS